MRTSILAIIVVAGSAIAFPAAAQQTQAAPSEQTGDQKRLDADKGLKTSEPDRPVQRDADKEVETRNSGESGYVADQDKPGTSAHPRADRKVSTPRVRVARLAPRNRAASEVGGKLHQDQPDLGLKVAAASIPHAQPSNRRLSRSRFHRHRRAKQSDNCRIFGDGSLCARIGPCADQSAPRARAQS